MTAVLALDILLWVFVGRPDPGGAGPRTARSACSTSVWHPAGALMPTTGPKVGELTEAVDADDLTGTAHRIGGPSADDTLVLFISPTCPVCKALLPAARSLAAAESLRLLFASDGFDAARHRAFAADVGLERFPYVLVAGTRDALRASVDCRSRC